MTMRGPRATTVILRLQAFHADSSIAMRIGQREFRSLMSYQYLEGVLRSAINDSPCSTLIL